MRNIFWENLKKNAAKEESSRPKGVPSSAQGSCVVALTTRCNFQCRHCLRKESGVIDLPFETLEKLARSARKYHFGHMSLTGGEPLLYPFFKEAVELIVSCGYSFNFVTNGYVFDKFSEFLLKYRKNLLDIIFSLESVDEACQDDMRRKGSYVRLLEDFSICRRSKLPFIIQSVITTLNFDELFSLALFAKKKGARALRLSTALPCARTANNSLVLDSVKRGELFILLKQVSKILKFPVYYTSAIRSQDSVTLCSAIGITELALNVNGDFAQCCDLADHDMERVRKNAVITSLKDKTFAEALKIISEYQHKFRCSRIDDYQRVTDPSDLDFNSCFYCINTLDRSKE